MKTGVEATDTLGVRWCPDCRDEKRRQAALVESITWSAQSKVFRPWTHDKCLNEIYDRVRREIHAAAQRTLLLGFVQSKKKPWLFYKETPVGVVFADFGGTSEVPIGEDRSALIYQDLSGPLQDQRVVVREVIRRLEAENARTRFSFYAASEPGGLFFGEDEREF